MKIKHMTIVATLALGLIAIVPTISAIPLGCSDPDGAGDASILAPPRGEDLGWTSDCVHVRNGGTARIQSLDPLSLHGAIREECFSLGTIDAAATQTVKFQYSAAEEILYATQNGSLGVCDSFEIQDGVIALHYQCVVHGSVMSGTIVIEL